MDIYVVLNTSLHTYTNKMNIREGQGEWKGGGREREREGGWKRDKWMYVVLHASLHTYTNQINIREGQGEWNGEG